MIAKKALEAFWMKHPAARTPLEAWYRIIRRLSPVFFSEIKRTFNSADFVAPYNLFNLGGNNFRVITVIHYNRQKLYIRGVFTHTAHDRWSKVLRSK